MSQIPILLGGSPILVAPGQVQEEEEWSQELPGGSRCHRNSSSFIHSMSKLLYIPYFYIFHILGIGIFAGLFFDVNGTSTTFEGFTSSIKLETHEMYTLRMYEISKFLEFLWKIVISVISTGAASIDWSYLIMISLKLRTGPWVKNTADRWRVQQRHLFCSCDACQENWNWNLATCKAMSKSEASSGKLFIYEKGLQSGAAWSLQVAFQPAQPACNGLQVQVNSWLHSG